ncbi:hypothetical protein ANN_24980, partial [Periplaneta americana]
VVVITEDVQNVHLLIEYRPHIDVSLTCEHDPKLQEYCVCPQNMPQFDSKGIPNQAPETNKPMILNGPTSRNREGSDQLYERISKLAGITQRSRIRFRVRTSCLGEVYSGFPLTSTDEYQMYKHQCYVVNYFNERLRSLLIVIHTLTCRSTIVFCLQITHDDPKSQSDREVRSTLFSCLKPHGSPVMLSVSIEVQPPKMGSSSKDDIFDFTDSVNLAMSTILGKGQLIVDMLNKLQDFSRKLTLFVSQLREVLLAIDAALQCVTQISETSICILTDSKGVTFNIIKYVPNLYAHRIIPIQKQLSKLKELQKEITFQWIPSHCGISGNKKVDNIAKQTTYLQPRPLQVISLSNAFASVKSHFINLWINNWLSSDKGKIL